MASSLVFQPGPAFGKTTPAKAFGYAKVSVRVSHALSLYFLQGLFLQSSLWMSVCQLSSPVVEERE